MLVLKNRAVSPQRAQEMNSEFNIVSVTFESRSILLLNRLIDDTHKGAMHIFQTSESPLSMSSTKYSTQSQLFF